MRVFKLRLFESSNCLRIKDTHPSSLIPHPRSTVNSPLSTVNSQLVILIPTHLPRQKHKIHPAQHQQCSGGDEGNAFFRKVVEQHRSGANGNEDADHHSDEDGVDADFVAVMKQEDAEDKFDHAEV